MIQSTHSSKQFNHIYTHRLAQKQSESRLTQACKGGSTVHRRCPRPKQQNSALRTARDMTRHKSEHFSPSLALRIAFTGLCQNQRLRPADLPKVGLFARTSCGGDADREPRRLLRGGMVCVGYINPANSACRILYVQLIGL